MSLSLYYEVKQISLCNKNVYKIVPIYKKGSVTTQSGIHINAGMKLYRWDTLLVGDSSAIVFVAITRCGRAITVNIDEKGKHPVDSVLKSI